MGENHALELDLEPNRIPIEDIKEGIMGTQYIIIN